MYKCGHVGCRQGCKSIGVQINILTEIANRYSQIKNNPSRKNKNQRKTNKKSKATETVPHERYSPRSWESTECYCGDADTNFVASGNMEDNSKTYECVSNDPKRCFCLKEFLAQPFAKKSKTKYDGDASVDGVEDITYNTESPKNVRNDQTECLEYCPGRARLKQKIMCICRKLSQVTTSSARRMVGKCSKRNCAYSDNTNNTFEKTVKDAVDQVDEPSFQMTIGATNMTVLNVDETKTSLNTLGKKKTSCRCPSSKIRRNLEFAPRKICPTGVCRRTHNKSTYFDCKCRKPPKFCTDQTCDLKNKPLLKPADRIKPIFSVNLDADSMRILNAEQVHDRIVRYEKIKCQEGKCKENTARGYRCRCFIKKRPEIVECGNETCKKCGCNPCECMNSSTKRRSKYFHKRGNLEICVAKPKCNKCAICPAKGAGECVCQNKKSEKNTVSRRQSLQKNIHRRHSLSFRFTKNSSRNRRPENTNVPLHKCECENVKCVCEKCHSLIPPDPCENARPVGPFERDGKLETQEMQWGRQKQGTINKKLDNVTGAKAWSNPISIIKEKTKVHKERTAKKKNSDRGKVK